VAQPSRRCLACHVARFFDFGSRNIQRLYRGAYPSLQTRLLPDRSIGRPAVGVAVVIWRPAPQPALSRIGGGDPGERVSEALSCREATKADLPHVLRLYAQPEIDDGRVLPLSVAEKIFQRMARYPDYRIYVAQLGHLIVGTFALLIMDNIGHLGARSGVVEDVAVDPQYQRLGVGRFMMQHALACCRQKDCYKLALSSNLKREKAHAFYELLGFERHGYSFRMDLSDPSGRLN